MKQLLGPNLASVWASGASKKICPPLLISATFEASNFNFATQLGFGGKVAITTLVPNLVGAGWAMGALKNCGDHVPCTPCRIPCTTLQLQKCNKAANVNVKKL